MMTFAVLAILFIIIVLVFHRKHGFLCLESNQESLAIFVLIEKAINFITKCLRRKRRRTRIRVGAVF